MITGIFKKGDIVKFPEVWNNKLFVVDSFHGNKYLPEMSVFFLGTNKRLLQNRCNFDIRRVILKNAENRPFRNLELRLLAKLILKKNLEAKRELTIRNNRKL